MHYINKILKSNFLRESVVYGLTGALSRFSVFLTLPIYTRYLSVEEFGVLDLYVTIGMIIFLLFEMQMKSGFMRSYYEKQSENKLNELLGSTLQYYLIIFFFSLAVLFILYFVKVDASWWDYGFIVPLVLLVFPKQIFDLNNVILRMEHKSKKFLIYNVSKIFTIALLGIVAVVLNSSVETILWSMFAGNLVFGMFAFWNIKRHMYISLNCFHFKEIFTYGAPLVPAILSNRAMSAVGRFYIISYLSAEALGVFSIALKIGMIYMIFVEAFRLAWAPFSIKKFGESDAKHTFARALNIYVFTGLLMIVAIYLFSPLFLNILATQAYAQAIDLLPVLLMAYFWQGAINIISVGNGWVRKSYHNAIGSAFGGIVTVVILHIAIEKIGIHAAAIGQMFGFMASFFMTLYFAQKNVKIQFSYKIIAIITSISLYLVFYTASQ